MPKELDVNEQAPPIRQIWVVYNHMPYGTVAATHFETTIRNQKLANDTVRKTVYSPEEQLEAFKQTPQVALYTVRKNADGKEEGKLEKNKVLVYPAEKDLRGVNDPAGVALKWGEEQGVRKVPDPKDAQLPKTDVERIAKMESRVATLEEGQNKMASALERLAIAIEKQTASKG